ncbi:MAG: YgiT-type zinc finger protein [Planctomycetes bacterium]|nr:YgiT-type zinc finger protein [Planctomycetota bacterium]
MRKRETSRAFWEGERCEYCDGPIKEKTTDLTRKVKGKYIILENVPTGVCSGCGTRYYAANILKNIEEAIRKRKKLKREVKVPIYSL